jgi:hypothetical protein
VRLNRSSQLAGFAKEGDLADFARTICGIETRAEPALVPTPEMLAAYRGVGRRGKARSWAPQASRSPGRTMPRSSAAASCAASSRVAASTPASTPPNSPVEFARRIRLRLPALQRSPAPRLPPPRGRRVSGREVGGGGGGGHVPDRRPET